MTSSEISPADKIYKIINARLLLNHEIVEDSYLWYQNGKIIHPQNLFFSARRDADEIIDAKGLLVVPGFIDTQINGAYGIDFADYEEPVEVLKKNIDTVAKGLLQYGCTAFCPTVVSSSPAVYEKVRDSRSNRKKKKKKVGILKKGLTFLCNLGTSFVEPSQGQCYWWC